MKEKLQKHYIVINRKKWNGDTLFILLNKSNQRVMASFSVDFNSGVIYDTNFRDLTIYQLKEISDILEEIQK